ncbi:MAG: glucosamine-6-phosphate deaminase [Planctomycetota bacterium]|jgi:glucosamine-6-phosphate deaminase
MKHHPCTTPEDVAATCADDIARILARRPEAVLILPAGNTPKPLFRELVRRHEEGTLDMSRAHIVQLDELVGIPPEDSRSFNAFLRDFLLKPLGRDGTRDHLMRGDADDAAEEIARHGADLEGLGAVDLAVLGIGLNGHVAFNEPGTRATDGARLLQLAAKTIEGLEKEFEPQELPRTGITLGLVELRAAKTVRILATGTGKGPILGQLLSAESSSDLPAARLAPHDDLVIFSDEGARGA